MTAASASTDPRVDPRVARSRELILDAALDHFLKHGFLAATVDAIAVEAGVAKRTVYNLFGSKDDLFRAVIGRATATAENFVEAQVGADTNLRPVDDEIREFAVAHAAAVVTPRVVATRRLLIAEAHRFPELATEYFERVPRAVIEAVAERLQHYARSGDLALPDALAAAEHFAYLVLGAALDHALFDPTSIDARARDAAALAGADVFLRAYRAGG
ncbi:TetR/AcrR family transcriptional regulator [Subtercola sp. YIM 133946]|uniref:TetR/AcrR family transcriptional regulator n=1 Tax=Subtercola sp. YIM 133946 TaxID=3118909 RepID=UPI002F9522E9